jgi:hypothetical protein
MSGLLIEKHRQCTGAGSRLTMGIWTKLAGCVRETRLQAARPTRMVIFNCLIIQHTTGCAASAPLVMSCMGSRCSNQIL